MHFLAVSNNGTNGTTQTGAESSGGQYVQYVESVHRVGTPSSEQIVYSNGQAGNTM